MLICILTKNVIAACSVNMMLFLHLEVKPLMTLTTVLYLSCFFFSSRRRHTRLQGDWSSDVCSSDLSQAASALVPRSSWAIWSTIERRSWRDDAMVRASAGRMVATTANTRDRKSTRLNSSHLVISYAVFCLKKKNNI